MRLCDKAPEARGLELAKSKLSTSLEQRRAIPNRLSTIQKCPTYCINKRQRNLKQGLHNKGAYIASYSKIQGQYFLFSIQAE